MRDKLAMVDARERDLTSEKHELSEELTALTDQRESEMNGLRDVLRQCAVEAEAREHRLHEEIDGLKVCFLLGALHFIVVCSVCSVGLL